MSQGLHSFVIRALPETAKIFFGNSNFNCII